MRVGIHIIASPHEVGSVAATVSSLKCLSVPHSIYTHTSYHAMLDVLDSYEEEWLFFLYKYEALDFRLVDAIPVLIQEDAFSAFIFYALNRGGTTPSVMSVLRMIRKGVKLRTHSFDIEDNTLKVLPILDGWIYEQGSEYAPDKDATDGPVLTDAQRVSCGSPEAGSDTSTGMCS